MLYFLVYGDDKFKNYIHKLLESVKTYGPEFEIIIFNKGDISLEFVTKYKSILNYERGGGYWLWKPYIINETLKKINDNDILFYMDSRYYFIENFTEYIVGLLKKQDMIVWNRKPNCRLFYMKEWCKMDVINKYNIYKDVFVDNKLICWAGAIVVRKTDTTCAYISEWLDMCCDYNNITDSPSITPNNRTFKEHRHDQSLLTIILYKYNIPMHNWENNRYLQNERKPF
jgi:hypothetical protein